jgi:fatty-acyl-CoA synthase
VTVLLMTPGWHAQHTPDAPAIVMGSTGETATYAELKDRSSRLMTANENCPL